MRTDNPFHKGNQETHRMLSSSNSEIPLGKYYKGLLPWVWKKVSWLEPVLSKRSHLLIVMFPLAALFEIFAFSFLSLDPSYVLLGDYSFLQMAQFSQISSYFCKVGGTRFILSLRVEDIFILGSMVSLTLMFLQKLESFSCTCSMHTLFKKAILIILRSYPQFSCLQSIWNIP